jgi:hypothetical protein
MAEKSTVPCDFDRLIAGEDLLGSFDVDNIRVRRYYFRPAI